MTDTLPTTQLAERGKGGEKSNVPTIGAHVGISFEEYSRWQATNWHSLAPFALSALEGHHAMARPDDATDSMVLGGAFHTAILEPHKFESTYAVMPDFDGHPNSNAYKSAKAAWREHHTESVELTKDDLSQMRGMQRAVAAHPVASAILKSKGRNEISIVWRDKETGELCKGRIDRLCRLPASILDPNTVGEILAYVDFKSTAKFHQFDQEVARYKYHGQVAFYGDGLQSLEPAPLTPLIIAIQSCPPFDVAVYTCADAVEHGRRLYRRLLNDLVRCRASKRWPGIAPVGTIPIILPNWAKEAENSL